MWRCGKQQCEQYEQKFTICERFIMVLLCICLRDGSLNSSARLFDFCALILGFPFFFCIFFFSSLTRISQITQILHFNSPQFYVSGKKIICLFSFFSHLDFYLELNFKIIKILTQFSDFNLINFYFCANSHTKLNIVIGNSLNTSRI